MKIAFSGKRIEVENGCLTVSFNLSAEPGPLVSHGHQRWYSGSATSIRYRDSDGNDVEMLDFNRHFWSWKGHDPEKRGLQLSQVTLRDPVWANGVTVDLYDRDYLDPSAVIDRERCSFSVCCPLVGAEGRFTSGPADFYLRRTLSLEHGRNFLREEVSVCRANDRGLLVEGAELVDFEARYFMLMDCGANPSWKDERSQGRFTVAMGDGTDFFEWTPRFAYGYACIGGASISNIEAPVGQFPLAAKAHKTFSWETTPTSCLRAIHLITMGNETDYSGALLRTLWP